jgi:hypothetical protein
MIKVNGKEMTKEEAAKLLNERLFGNGK